MAEENKRALSVFLCHASEDKPTVRKLYKHLFDVGVDAWLDEEKILPGQDWNKEILKALQNADAIIICLSKKSVAKEGYVQREIKEAIKKAEEKPFGTIFVIPVKLDDCDAPNYLRDWQWVDLFGVNGYPRLLKSLRERANEIGVLLGNEKNTRGFIDEELEGTLRQLLVDGRAAMWVENWDKAIQLFNKILDIKYDYPGASEQLAEAERRKTLSILYSEGVEAYQANNWDVAISVLEQLLQGAINYKDAGELLEFAKKRKLLSNLYKEAQELSTAKQWKAVIKIFEQIDTIDNDYGDPENLLVRAQKEIAQIVRMEEIKSVYAQAVNKIEDGNLREAQKLLNQINEIEPGFSETENLLEKVELEISKEDEIKKRDSQINSLYEQVSEFVRLKKWREAQEKIDKIYKLDNKYSDPAKNFQIVRKELRHEQEEIKSRTMLAIMYTDAVKLVGEEKYAQALEKWREIRVLDAKYPDRQRIERTINRKLSEQGKRTIFQFLKRNRFVAILATCVVFISIVTSIIFFANQIPAQLPSPTPSLLSRIEDEKGILMLLVPAGKFTMGRNDSEADQAPSHEVYLDAYYIDQYEVTNAMYSMCVQTGFCEPPNKNSSKTHLDSYYNNPNFDKYPVVYVDWEKAETYCKWRDARLPTEAEWEKAARGTDERIYPWGNDAPSCNRANYINCPQVDTQEVTKYSLGKSPYGVYNMAGNVWEWVSDWYTADYYQNSPKENPTGPSSGYSRVMRGGAFYDQFTELTTVNRVFRSPIVSNYDIGFRCARSVSPSFP